MRLLITGINMLQQVDDVEIPVVKL